MFVCEPETIEGKCRLKIKYSVTAHSMLKFFHSGTVIDKESPLYLPLLTGETFSGLIHSDEIGPGGNNYRPYMGECFCFGAKSSKRANCLSVTNKSQRDYCCFSKNGSALAERRESINRTPKLH